MTDRIHQTGITMPYVTIENLIAPVTKRELFAAMAMQGILSRNAGGIDQNVEIAVEYADALIKALRE